MKIEVSTYGFNFKTQSNFTKFSGEFFDFESMNFKKEQSILFKSFRISSEFIIFMFKSE